MLNFIFANRSRFSYSVVCLAIGLTAGCGGSDEWTGKRPKVYKAGGVVTLGGAPLEEATVIYHSSSHDLSAQGVTDKQGRFTLMTFDPQDGAVEGKHKVSVTKRTYEKKKTKYDSPTESSVALIPKELLPIRYALPTTTTIEVEVSASGDNDAKIEVKSK